MTIETKPRTEYKVAPELRDPQLDAHIPSGPIAEKWEKAKFDYKLVNPANKRKYTVIVVGSGLAGGAAAASLGELGYNVHCFCYQDSPRRAHSIAAQGGINAAKNYRNDGDSVYRLFYDTIKGGDFRAREANVHRLAEVSVNIIDQCVAQGVPFAREYGGTLDNRSFGGAQVSRTFYARGQTGQQLLIGAYQSLWRKKSRRGTSEDVFPLRNARSRGADRRPWPAGIVIRNMVTGEMERHTRAMPSCWPLAVMAMSSIFPQTRWAAMSPRTWRAHKRKGAYLRQPVLHADSSDLHPGQRGVFRSKLTLMSESLAQRRARSGCRSARKTAATETRRTRSPRTTGTTILSGNTRASAILPLATSASRAAKEACDDGPRRWSGRIGRVS